MQFRLPPAIVMRRQLGGAAAVALIATAALYCAYWLRFEAGIPEYYLQQYWGTLPRFVLVKVAVFAALGQLTWSRFVTFHDLVALIRATTLSTALVLVAGFMSAPYAALPRSIVLLDWGGTLLAIGGLRMLVRIIDEREPSQLLSVNQTPVFIIGAGVAGETLLRTIRRHRELAYRVVGFISLDPADVHTRIGGVPVIGALGEVCELAVRYGVKQMLITAGELEGRQVRELVEAGRQHQLNTCVLPRIDQLLDGVELKPREVSIEDLLRRDPVSLNLEAVNNWLDDKVVMVTGSAGSIGSEIARQLSRLNPRKLVLVDRSENGQFFLERELSQLGQCELEVCMGDITDGLRMAQLFRTHKIDIVFHAAAYKHVPLMEANPGEAIKNITFASRMLADLAHQYNAESFVMISTDKAVNPTSVMGACKRTAELYVQSLAEHSSTRFVTVRFGNVLGSAGSVIPVFRQQIAEGGPLTVTHPDMTRYFMTIPEASQLVIQAGAMGNGGEIFVLDMGQPVKIVDLARDLIRLSGLQEGKDIQIQFVGMRPGEKLYEELLVDGEKHLPTAHPKIMVAQSDHCGLPAMKDNLTQLAKQTERDGDSVRLALQQIVPQYGQPSRRAA
ncbi:MAG: polysaccharide biosynthesis protein [Planctomycetales bacterium]|nr:polysaccharide biosynthesis protein [Planctomycetales bacterium]